MRVRNVRHILNLNYFTVFEENYIEFGTVFTHGLTIKMFLYLAFTHTINITFLNSTILFLCLITKKSSFNLDSSSIHKLKSQKFDHFSLLTFELFVGRLNNSHEKLPVLKIYIEVADFLKFFQTIWSDKLGLRRLVDLEESSSCILVIGMTVLTFMTGISLSVLFIFLFLRFFMLYYVVTLCFFFFLFLNLIALNLLFFLRMRNRRQFDDLHELFRVELTILVLTYSD